MTQNPIHRLRQGVDNHVGLARPIFGVPGFLAEAVAGADEDSAATGEKSQFHIGVTITDDEGASKVEMVIERGALEHADFGLAAIAGIGRGMRANVDAIKTSPCGGQIMLQAVVDFANQRLRKIPASHPGLVRYYYDWEASVVQASDGRRGERKDTKTGEMIQVTDLFGEGAVTIEENGGAGWDQIRQKAPPRNWRAWLVRPWRG